MRIIRYLSAFTLLFQSFVSIAADKSAGYKIQWLPVYEKKISEETTFRTLNFSGASFDENYNPQFVFTQPLTSFATEIRVQLRNVVTEPLTDISLVRNISAVTNDFTITSRVVTQKKKSLASISVFPIRKSAAGGYEKLVSFDADIQPVYGAARTTAVRTYASSSVLATGDWYKISVIQNGVYKIDYTFLKKAGIDIDNIDPTKIQLYGNGGGMLAYLNSTFRYDDLQQNAIYVSGEADGHFDPEDYILFYGTNQTKWTYDAATRQFNHQVNQYADTTYYFITINDLTPSKRIQQRANGSGGTLVNSYDDYIYHEADLTNFLKSGREWFGESMDNLNNSLTINTSVPNLIPDSVFFRSNLAGRAFSSGANAYTLSINGVSQGSQSFSNVGTSTLDPFYIPVTLNKTILNAGNSALSVKFTLSSGDPSAIGWLNYFEMNFRRSLSAAGMGNQFLFRDKNSVGPGNVSEFQIPATNANWTIWDVTDRINVVKQETSLINNSTTTFTVPTDIMHEFIAFDGQHNLTPLFTGTVANQNLHALAQANMIIVTNALFLQQAYDLADFHRTHDNLTVAVATTQQIFNEFSSGAQDVSAIRDFIKMFYDRAATPADMPRFACLMGDASYDNKYRVPSNTNYVTSYQSAGSVNLTQTYMSDDFFGLLDDGEGEWTSGEVVDMSVGRLPVKSVSEAESAVKKIKHYVEGNGAGQPNPTMGAWRNMVTFVADDQDQNTHLRQTDTLANRVMNAFPNLNVDKIYLDAYTQESSPGGQRYPDAQNAIIEKVERGSLLVTYIGHGGELGWAHERVLEVSDINGWGNFDHLAALLTATCEFTRVDDPGRTSAGELAFLNANGGAICLFTTSRLAFSSSNFNLCQKFFTHVFDNSSGEYPTSGEVFERTKVDYFSDPFVRNFILIGDPAVRIAYPKFNVETKTVNGVDISQPIDTLKALSKITITGEVQDASGNRMNNFNGIIYPTVYDKMATYYTLGNDRFLDDASVPQAFPLQKNVIYSGKASVVNGGFTFTFVVPKDISFQYGKGKVSYYAQNGEVDATGHDTIEVVGGLNPNIVQDGEGPKIKLYINDEKFVRGGMTDKNPVLYAIIEDSSGVNTVGTGIGHDMTAELDSKSEKRYVLNDYYENDLDSYQAGKVRYQFKELAPGPHSLMFKVWDVYNNSSYATTDFVVSESAELALDHVLNYPNPFTTHTTFMFEHNRPYVPLDVQVQIFTVSGKLIKTISDKITTAGYRSDAMEWNGLDDYGDRIGRGVYVYRLRVRTIDGEYADKFEKLVILR